MNDWLNLIGNVGFPIAVAAYLLIRIEGRLVELSDAINELREAVITIPVASRSGGRCCDPAPVTTESPQFKDSLTELMKN